MEQRRDKSTSTVPPASMEEVATSIQRVQAMSQAAKEALVEEIFKQQPNLLGHVLVLSKLDVPMPKVDVVLHVWLVLYDLFTGATPGTVPQVTIDELESIDDNHWALMRLMESEEPSEASRLVQLAAQSHPEVNAFAFAIKHLMEAGVSDMMQKEDEYCMRSARNLVDAFARARRVHAGTGNSTPPKGHA